jgi:ABC-2 type transport system ATP-binding protein
MAEISITVKDLTKKFGDFTAVNSINFDIQKGEIFGFLGPNGAGKTTTIRMLCGLIDPTSGEATVGGFRVSDQQEDIKKIIGYMSQKFSLYDDLTVAENIDFFAGIYQTPRRTREQKKQEIIRISELVGKENVLTGELAAALKQHLALGCALINEPRVIFLDEPTAGVDPLARKKFWEIIKMLAKTGVTVLVTTHYMDEAENCDRIAFISDGLVIACDSPENLKSNEMKGFLYEIECDKVMKALELLRKLSFIREIALYGIYLHAVIEDEKYAEDIRSALTMNFIGIKRMERVIPSLEDVFVSLVEAQNRKNLPAGRHGNAENK